MESEITSLASILGISLGLLIIIIIWSAVWKGIALWKAARKNSLVWFIVLLVVNTLGILEILYIYVFSEMKNKKVEDKKSRKK